MKSETIAGFELREGVSITDLDSWPSFAEWWERQYGFPPVVGGRPDSRVKEIFEAYLEGAQWQHRSTPPALEPASSAETAAFHRGVDAAKEAIRSEVTRGSSDEARYHAACFITAIARKCGVDRRNDSAIVSFVPHAPWTPCDGDNCTHRSHATSSSAELESEEG